MPEEKVRLCRLIRPGNPRGRVNIYTQFTKRTTNDGLIKLATIINKLWGWRAEVIDEENYWGPRDGDGLPDHEMLQHESPADVVGFYCGLTSTIERVWELSAFYKSQGVITLGGSWHAHYCPEETLCHNIDLVVHGDAELEIVKVFANIDNGRLLHEGVGGVSYLDGIQVKHILPNLEDAGQMRDCDSRLLLMENRLSCEQLTVLPYSDFGLLRFGKIRFYPIGRIRGCSMGCKFCTVKTGPRWANAEWLFGLVNWLVETRKARWFFIVDDRSEEDLQGTIKFFEMVAAKYGRRLRFTVQMRLPAARNAVLMDTMKRAGVRSACIGIESPIDEELNAMGKGLTSKSMVELVRVWHRYSIRVHEMFIFGFPVSESDKSMSTAGRVKAYKRFIGRSRADFIQVLSPIPLPGSELREELKKAGRLFPLEVAPWNKYDGNFVLIKPVDGLSLRELQSAHTKIMAWFYGPFSFLKMIYRTFYLVVDYFLRGWDPWRSDWGRDVVVWLGHSVVNRWLSTRENEKHLESLEKKD
ncbi:MAG: hypothetical protein NTV36_02845 [Candidatus Staskawiczbacteria bacterium]|nr:hypothetical protein [Candidatus Staskawiczbacteria bacterium]